MAIKTEAVRYRVVLSRPHTHLLEVEARFPAVEGVLEATLPVWTPGSYSVREFARHLRQVRAEDATGAPLPLSRTDKRTWRVEAGGRPVTLRYQVYARELSVRTSHVDDSHAFFNGANVFLLHEPSRQLPHRVQVVAPRSWRTFVALPEEAGEYVAAGYDALVDAPFEVGPHTPTDFPVRGVPHALVVWGEPQPDTGRLAADLARVCEAAASLFGGLPLTRYLFLVHLTERTRGGLEHADSSVLHAPRFPLSTPRGWEDFLTLAAHEYFHLWSVKRITPRALLPPDYGREAYTSLLWAFEGGTSYYDNLLVRRAGLMTPARYLTRLGETLSTLHAVPGRRVQTLEESSRTAWLRHLRPDEHAPNSTISYYLKGEVVAVLLDLRIRRATGDARSLDDVFRLLWQRYGDGSGVPEEGVEQAAQEVAGVDLSDFFARAVRSTEELDYSPFHHVGLEVRLRPRESPADKGGGPARSREGELAQRGWLGASVRSGGTVTAVVEDSPAWHAGLSPDDEVVALDGFRVDAGSLLARCEERRPGDTVRLTFFRRDRLREVALTLGRRPLDAAWLARVEAPSEAQKAAWAAWMGSPWEGSEG